MTKTPKKPLKYRSQNWFDNPDNADMTALYLERYLNYGFTRGELQGHKPIIGIAQTGSDLSPCNRAHVELVKRIRDGIYAAGGIPMEFPVHPIQETGKRPTASLDRNLSYLSIVEVLYGYPLDGVVLTIGCDKTTPACLMAAATVDIPAICLSSGPMLNGWYKGQRTGSGTIVWMAREKLATGELDYEGFVDLVATSAPSTGFCNTMGTATTMNSLTEALGMSLPGNAAIPAPYRERGQMAYETGRRIVDDGGGGPDTVQDHDAQGLRECHCGEHGHWRLDQRAQSSQCHCRSSWNRADGAGLGEARLRPAAAGQPPACGRISRRGLSPRRRRARRGGGTHQGRQDPRGLHHGQWQDHRRELQGQVLAGTVRSSRSSASR